MTAMPSEPPCVEDLTALARRVLAALLEHTGRDHTWCCPGQRRLAELVGRCGRTIRRAIAQLERAGAIVARTHRFKSSDSFWLHPALVKAHWRRAFQARHRKNLSTKPARLPSGAEARTSYVQPSTYSKLSSSATRSRANGETRKEEIAGTAAATTAMIALGMRTHVVHRVLADHGIERCRKQLEWLPYRPAVERPEAYLYCAIVDNFPEPRSYAAARAAETERERARVAAQRERDDRVRRLADEEQAEQQRRACAHYLASLSARDRAELHALASADVIARGTRDGHPLFDLQVRCAVNARLSAIVRDRSRYTRIPERPHSSFGDLS